MKTMASIIACLLLAMSGRASDRGQQYASRYEKWLPYVSNTLVVRISVGDTSRGLSSGSLSAHLHLREPAARRPDGTPVTGHAVVTIQEMQTLLKLIDETGSYSSFSTCEDDNWREPQGEPTRAQVVWSSKNKGHTYDWFVFPQARMPVLLQKVRGSLRTKEALDVIEGLIVGCNSSQGSEKKKADKPAAGNAGIASWLTIGHHWPGIGELNR